MHGKQSHAWWALLVSSKTNFTSFLSSKTCAGRNRPFTWWRTISRRDKRAKSLRRLGSVGASGWPMKKRIKLVSFKRKDENRYSTFSNVSFAASDDKLAFKQMPKQKLKREVAPGTHKASSKAKKPTKRKRWITRACCLDRKWIRRVFCVPCLFCFYACCKRRSVNLGGDDDVDKAVAEYKKSQEAAGSAPDSQRSTLKSEMGASRFWSWDESWKSNSDKFLESLELDGVGSDKSLKRKLRQKNSRVRLTAFDRFIGGGWRDEFAESAIRDCSSTSLTWNLFSSLQKKQITRTTPARQQAALAMPTQHFPPLPSVIQHLRQSVTPMLGHRSATKTSTVSLPCTRTDTTLWVHWG